MAGCAYQPLPQYAYYPVPCSAPGAAPVAPAPPAGDATTCVAPAYGSVPDYAPGYYVGYYDGWDPLWGGFGPYGWDGFYGGYGFGFYGGHGWHGHHGGYGGHYSGGHFGGGHRGR